MSIKVVDSDSAINLFERLTCFDCVPFVSGYRTIITDVVAREMDIDGLSERFSSAKVSSDVFNPPAFINHKLTVHERRLAEKLNLIHPDLGPGERSAIAHALFLTNSSNGERIFLISDDKEARHAFTREIFRDPSIRERFPSIDTVSWVRSEDVLKLMKDKGLIGPDDAQGIYEQLKPIMGPRRLGFLKD